jgi:hypothetical protein
VWQEIYERIRRPDVELIAIALDPGGPEAPRPFVEAAGVTFPVLVDATGQASGRYGFKLVPNGILIDEAGIIRYRRDGGFSNTDARDLEATESFARGDDPGESPARADDRYTLGPLERDLIDTKMELGRLQAASGHRDEAVRYWQDALHRDPDNLTIRKAIWAERFPERFHPVIDFDWQDVQLLHERAEEIAQGFCGPDGCPLPQADDSGIVASG